MKRTYIAVCIVMVTSALPAAAGRVEASHPLISTPTRFAPIVEEVFSPAAGALAPASTDPVAELITFTAVLSRLAGFEQDPTTAVLAADVPRDVAASLVWVQRALATCIVATARARNAVGDAAIVAATVDGTPLLEPALNDIATCAPAVWRAATALERAVAATPAPLSLDVWPVVKMEDAGDTTYLNDYMIIVDTAGNDIYDNNSGGNSIDLNYAPAGSAVPGIRGFGPALGCRSALSGLVNLECVPLAGVLIDTAGDDVYNPKHPASFDARCTNDPVVTRQVTGGSGFLGVSALIDSAGNDSYAGKTGALGTGHLYGVGILEDRAGNDTYTVVRNGQGVGFLSALGVLRDIAGDDVYDFYMPAAIVEGAADGTNGAGGVVDDQSVCDTKARFTLGAGNLFGSLGIFVDHAGDDDYTGGYSDTFKSPPFFPTGRGGAIGFANNQSTALFLDEAGTDKYAITGAPGAGTRRDGALLLPDATCQSSTCLGVFADRNG
ncbi:MAG TPA: hypothetical protein VM600_10190 [Actinomycetota bacterium]|nr:hypothetical protein [Actinomycetota bacterium]